MVTIRFRESQSWSVQVRDHQLVCDQPPENGGTDAGPAPAEWFAASLGACIGHYAHAYLEARSLPSDGLAIDVSWETESSPKRIARIETRLTLPPGVSEELRPRVLRAAEHCLIHNTLHHPPEVHLTIAGDATSGPEHSAA